MLKDKSKMVERGARTMCTKHRIQKNRGEGYFRTRTGEVTTSGREKMREWRSKGGTKSDKVKFNIK